MNSINQLTDIREIDEDDALVILQRTVDMLARKGFIATVSQKPLAPLAMGNYETVCEVRRKLVRE
jgi:hypothetical protein